MQIIKKTTKSNVKMSFYTIMQSCSTIYPKAHKKTLSMTMWLPGQHACCVCMWLQYTSTEHNLKQTDMSRIHGDSFIILRSDSLNAHSKACCLVRLSGWVWQKDEWLFILEDKGSRKRINVNSFYQTTHTQTQNKMNTKSLNYKYTFFLNHPKNPWNQVHAKTRAPADF